MKNTAPYQRGKGLEAGTRIGQKPAGVVISKTAWRLGGPTERRIMVLNGLIVIPMFTYIVVFLVLPLFTPEATPPDLVHLEILSLFMTMASYACFVKAIRSPTFTNAFLRTAIENNWFSPEESDFYREFVRYRETFGVQGQFRGDVRWAVGYWALAMAFITASAPVVLVLHPYLGGWAWVPLAVVVMPTSIYCWVAYARRTRAQYVRAETEGFPLASLYPWGWRRRKNAEHPPGL